MPWHTNSPLEIQDMYDLVYSHLIRTLKLRDTILEILAQVIIARSMPPDVGAFESDEPSNSSSPKWLTSNFGMTHGELGRAVADIHMLLKLGNNDQVISVRHTSLLEFLLDLSRSRELFGDVDQASLALSHVGIRQIFDTEGMWIVVPSAISTQSLIFFGLSIPCSFRPQIPESELGLEASEGRSCTV